MFGNRGITFCLTCCVTCVICFGLIVTVIAGIAYGYNYSFAEFITYTKNDVTVYMRRGQFYDHPDIAPPVPNRRMGDEDDGFFSNITSEYEEQDASKKDSESLSKKWLNDQDAREYAVKLTKYKENERIYVDDSARKDQQKKTTEHMSTMPSTRRLSKIPIQIPTTVWRSGSSQILLRKFLPLNDITDDFRSKESNDDLYKYNNAKYITKPTDIEYNERRLEKIQPDIKIRVDDIPERILQPIGSTTLNDQDYLAEEGNEDNILYKPV